MKDTKDKHKDAHVLSHPYDIAFKTGLKEGSPKLIVPLINAMFHLKIPLDKNVLIQRLNNELFLPDGRKEKITDSQLLIQNFLFHMECDCYAGSRIIYQMPKYDLNVGLNYADLNIEESILENPHAIPIPYSGVLFLRKPSDDHLSIVLQTPEGETLYHIYAIVINDYSLEDLCNEDLYFLIPFYLFNHEKVIGKYNTDKACRKSVNNVMHAMIHEINNAYKQDKIQIFDYRVLIVMMKTVTEGLTKDNKAMRKELYEIMSEGILRIPGKEYYLKVKGEGIEEGIGIGEDRGMIRVYYEDMKMSPADIAKKMNKPLDMVLKVIQKLTDQKNS